MTSLPSYAYNASAIGLGGVIRQGKRTTVIPTVGSVCLASAGGEASNQVDDYDRDGISFTRAQSRVGGYSSRKGRGSVRYSTFAEVLLLNLRIFDRISIARMQAVVTSTRDIFDERDPKKHLQPDQTRFQVKVMYHGVEIDGEEVDPEVDTELCEASSYAKFGDLLRGRKDRMPEETKKLIDAVTDLKVAGPPIGGPLVAFPGNANAALNRLKLPDFGSAHFGNIVVKQDRQRVGLLRINLDSTWSPRRNRRILASVAADTGDGGELTTLDHSADHGGSVTSGDSGSNGVPIWEQG